MPTCSAEGCTVNLNKRSLAKGADVCSRHRRKYPPVARVLCSHEGCETVLKGSSLKRKDGLCYTHKPRAEKTTTQQRERHKRLEHETDLIHFDVPCRNGCKATIPVNVWPGEKPSKYQYCQSCKNKSAGLSLQGIYN